MNTSVRSSIYMRSSFTIASVVVHNIVEQRREKTCLRGQRPGKTQTGMLSHRASLSLEISDIKTRGIVLSRQRTTAVLIRLRSSLIRAFVVRIGFSHDVAQLIVWSTSHQWDRKYTTTMKQRWWLDRNIWIWSLEQKKTAGPRPKRKSSAEFRF